MHKAILLIAVILILTDLILGIYHRFVQMPKWIAIPPASLSLMSSEATKTKSLSESISALFLLSAIAGLVLNWNHEDARSHIIASLIFFVLATVVNLFYFMKRRRAVSELSISGSQNVVVPGTIRSWMRWTLLRILLTLIAAGFISIAWNHV